MAAKKRSHPKFLRPNYGRSSRSRIKIAWRRPRGIDNKKRSKIAYMGCSPSIGYGQPQEIKYNHPSGLQEALIQTPSELVGLKEVVIRIAGGVGRKKREEIIRVAESMKLRVVNKAKKYAPKVVKVKKDDKKKVEEKKAETPKTDAKPPEIKTAEAPKQPEVKPQA
jgi:large subunit ribosomal protein L32e